jgi:hypothetical protein
MAVAAAELIREPVTALLAASLPAPNADRVPEQALLELLVSPCPSRQQAPQHALGWTGLGVV